jgi:pimeloyl-ACP methyl ester carboxylesterase
MHKERIRMRDLIVLLPGIMGSVLEKDGTDLWAAANRTIFSALRKRRRILQWLKLDGDDPEVDDLADGVTATRLISDARIAGFIKIDGYNRVSEMIKGNFDVIQGQVNTATRSHARANYFEFPYDWRRDNSASAQRLSRFLSVRLTEWRKYAGQGAKVILVAHSMGGIVARYYLEALGGWKDCKALITFGTPFRGSVKALDCLVNGCSVGPFDFTELVSSFTSVYQLLPIY